MANEANRLNQISFLMSQFLFTQSLRLRRGRLIRKRLLGERISHLYRVRKIYSRLCEERMLYMKMLTTWVQANAYCKSSPNRRSQWWEKTVKTFTDLQWLENFRMKKDTFSNLVRDIKCHKTPSGKMSVDKELAMTVLSLSSVKSVENIANLFGVSKSMAVSTITEMCQAIVKILMPRHLKFPDPKSLKEYLKIFDDSWGFPQCAGALGNMHVPILPSKLPENTADYINNDGNYSMYLQGIVDPTYRFWDVNIGWPGSVKESRVLTSSTLYSKGQDGKLFPNLVKNINDIDVPIFIIAGVSYPLADWIMRPYPYADTCLDEEIAFNEKLSFALGTADVAFKRLRARWNCLVMGGAWDMNIYPHVATACCILHNICEKANEPVWNEWIMKAENLYKQPLPVPCASIIGAHAETIQSTLKEHFNSQSA